MDPCYYLRWAPFGLEGAAGAAAEVGGPACQTHSEQLQGRPPEQVGQDPEGGTATGATPAAHTSSNHHLGACRRSRRRAEGVGLCPAAPAVSVHGGLLHHLGDGEKGELPAREYKTGGDPV